MIDLHCHLPVHLSDGPKDFGTAVRMLEQMAASGVRHVVAVSHFDPKLEDRLDSAVAALQPEAERCGITLDAAFEYDFSQISTGLKLRTLSPQSRYLLVDFCCYQLPFSARDMLESLEREGYHVIFVHPERLFSPSKLPDLEKLHQLGACFQINAISLLPEASAPVRRMARVMLRRGLVDVVASDAHRDTGRRRPCMGEAFAWLARKYTQKKADLLCQVNPQRLLENKPPLPILPAPLPWERALQWFCRFLPSRER